MIGGLMQCVRRSRMSVSDKAAMWERWKRGESLSEIGRALDRTPGAIFHVVRDVAGSHQRLDAGRLML